MALDMTVVGVENYRLKFIVDEIVWGTKQLVDIKVFQ